ncbi:MAG: ABC transporter ATP-binding protein [Actinomycetaceae bacterium]|nr:ABC transporter ATP-binding protein [Actinomycetaceae bacterium]
MSRRPQGRMPGEKPKNLRQALSRLFSALGPERAHMVIVTVLTVGAVALSVVIPMILGRATDTIFAGAIGTRLPAHVSKAQIVAQLRTQGQTRFADMLTAIDVTPGKGIDFHLLATLLVTVLGLYLASALLSWIAGIQTRQAVQRVAYRMRADVQSKIDRLPLKVLDGNARGDILSRVTNDVDNVAQTLQQSITQLLNSLFTAAGIFGLMLWVSWHMTLTTAIIMPFGMALTAFIMKRAQPHFTTQWQATGEVEALVEEAFSGHEVALLHDLGPMFAEHFAEKNQKLYRASFSAQWLSGLLGPIMTFTNNLAFAAVCVLGAFMVTAGQLTIGGVQAFIQYSRQLSQPLSTLAQLMNLLQSGGASAERVYEFLDLPEMEPDSATAHTSFKAAGARICFEDVTFGYEDAAPVINNLNLRVEPGQTVAIVGPTGAGKTTLVNLLMRFYEVDSGRITINGVDIRQLTRDALRSCTAMVLQETWLREGTIYENIAFGKEDATAEEIYHAAKMTMVDRIIRQLPQGYDTVIDGETGILSVGEKQLVTIARAFLKQPDILILDEATSSVDTRTEMLVQKAMAQLQVGRTAFVIAHRLSTIRDADQIIVMENGDVVEAGNHHSLLQTGGAYARLYQAQFAGTEI